MNAERKPESEQSDSPRPGWGRRLVSRLSLRFRLMDLMWLSAFTAVLMLWYQDHERLTNQLSSQNRRSSWSVRQVLGKPNTPFAGDQATAWASQGTSAKNEWLIVEFPAMKTATKLQIEETYNPGAVVRVCSVGWRGDETELWKGVDPTPVTAAKGTSVIKFNQPTKTRRVKIYIDSASVPGWNEIDAVALIDENLRLQWASDAWASSCFGDNQPLPEWFWP